VNLPQLFPASNRLQTTYFDQKQRVELEKWMNMVSWA